MSSKHMLNIRKKFIYPTKNVINWYPGHMDKELSYKPQILEKFKAENINNVIFTNCKDHTDEGIKHLLPKVINLIQNNKVAKSYYTLMVIGIPNVGKSSLINCLRNRFLKKEKATLVGANPGVTRSVLEKIKINEDPLIFLLDTPGIMMPSIKNIEVAFKLALCDTIKSGLIESDILADFLLFCLNRKGNFSYVDYLGLNEPCDDIRIVLLKTAVNLKKTFVVKGYDGERKLRPNIEEAANYFIRAFRKGQFGKLLLDEDLFLRKC